jgi:alpha-maltose-1-phosphate synthase
MSVLFGHPSGNPNSHHAALSHFESGRLEAFCVSWFPTSREIRFLKRLPGLASLSRRLERRCFTPLLHAPKIEGRLSEWSRMVRRVLFDGWISSEALAYEANDWLMETMARECERSTVTAVHSFEDCSLQQFKMAKRLGKACIYDMPIGYYPAWEETQRRLAAEFEEWLPEAGLSEDRYVRPAQKKREMELSDLVIGPSSFVARTIEGFHDKTFALAPYGVDSDFWHPSSAPEESRPLRFIYAGQVSLRKGIPLLLMAWERAGLEDAELLLVGSWQMANSVRRKLGGNVKYLPPCSAEQLRTLYQSADVFVFPSYFDGFGLVLLEAMACGLPVLASECTAAPDFLTPDCGSIASAGDLDAWIEALRLTSANRQRLPVMKEAARQVAIKNTWKRYRQAVSAGVDQLLS